MRVLRGLYLALKYYLAFCGGLMLVGLFFQRSLWLGLVMLVLVGLGFRDEIRRRWTTDRL